ncbi:hypothetical protein E4U55_001956 [Claviceps digitariae]|nr:hypothetical protein E4U55_001956 [Claviceps digitariae]
MTVYPIDNYAQLAGVALVLGLVYVSDPMATRVQKFIFSVLSNPTSKVPGPWYTKWTDLVSRYHLFNGEQVYYIHKLHAKYGEL